MRVHNAPWKRTEKDRAYQRRKAAADARAAVHVYDPANCKPGCLAKPLRDSGVALTPVRVPSVRPGLSSATPEPLRSDSGLLGQARG